MLKTVVGFIELVRTEHVVQLSYQDGEGWHDCCNVQLVTCCSY